MDVDNPLSQQFLLRHPVEAARVLEQLSTSDVAALISQIPSTVAATVFSAMLPNYAAACLSSMEVTQAAKLLNDIAVSFAARFFSLLGQEKQKEISDQLNSKHRKRIRRVLSYKSLSAGDLMNPNVDMLPASLTVEDAIRRIGKHRQTVRCELYVVDDNHRYLGVVDLGKLVTSRSQVRLGDIMSRNLKTLSVHSSSENLVNSSSWMGRQRLPVVESDNTLVGILDYSRLQETLDKDTSYSRDPMEGMFSLASLYWIMLIHFLDSMLNMAAVNKGDKQ